jgi:hypothetical protein
VAAGGDRAAADVDVDVIPPGEGALDGGERFGVGGAEVLEGLVREDDAPAEGVVGPVAFEDDDLVRRIRLLREQAEIESGGSSADADDLQGRPRAMDAIVYSAGAGGATGRRRVRRPSAPVGARCVPRRPIPYVLMGAYTGIPSPRISLLRSP